MPLFKIGRQFLNLNVIPLLCKIICIYINIYTYIVERIKLFFKEFGSNRYNKFFLLFFMADSGALCSL